MKQQFFLRYPGRFLLFALLCLNTPGAAGEDPARSVDTHPVEEWVDLYNGPASDKDEGMEIKVDSEGDIYITGYSHFNSDPNILTAKYDPAGNRLWLVHFPGDGTRTYAEAFDIDADGNVYAVGYIDNPVTDNDFITVMYDTDGNEIWSEQYDGPGSGLFRDTDKAIDVIAGDDGYIYVAGTSMDDITGNDYTLIKYDQDGSEMWVERYDDSGDGSEDDSVMGMAFDLYGNVNIAGLTLTSDSGRDILIAAYDSDGDNLWLSTPRENIYARPALEAIAIDGENNIYVTGRRNAYYYDLYQRYEDKMFYTAKYSDSGLKLWSACYNYNWAQDDAANALALDSAGNICVTGYSWGHAEDCDDYVTIKYGSTGNRLWIARFNGEGDGMDQPAAMAIDHEDSVYVTGSSDDINGSDTCATIKYDADGREVWTALYRGPFENARGHSLALDADGNVYVTGSALGDTGEYKNAFVLKYSQEINQAPQKPLRPSGRSHGLVKRTYDFTTSAADPNSSDELYYLFDWGDGASSDWLGFYSPGEIVTASHAWSRAGTYQIRVKAKDKFDVESGWSKPRTVRIGGTRPVSLNEIESSFHFGGEHAAHPVAAPDEPSAQAETVKTWYVDDDAPGDPGPGDVWVSDPQENGSRDHPFDTVQEAINTAHDGHAVLIADGTYTDAGNYNISFWGKRIMVESENGPDDCIVGRFLFDNGESKDAVLRGLTIWNNPSKSEKGRSGGGIYCYYASPTIENNIIKNNGSTWGGGIACYHSSAIIVNNIIDGNVGTERGGGVYCWRSPATITGNTISNNQAVDGGGISHYDENALINNNVIIDNIATNHGGGIYVLSGSPTITDNMIQGNMTMDGDGGGIGFYRGGPSIIAGNTITGNQATGGHGGGISFNPDYINPGTALMTIHENTVTGNTAEGVGGGIYLESIRAECWNNVITGNTAGSGGGIHCYDHARTTIFGNKISGNSALTGTGGAIHCQVDRLLTVKNNLITDNTAQTLGGAIYCSGSELVIIGTTLAGNEAVLGGGGGLSQISGSLAKIYNTIFWNNNAPSGKEIYMQLGNEPSTLHIRYSDLEGGQALIYIDSGCILDWGSGMINADPLFVTGTLGDYYISQIAAGQAADSPCVDTADPDSDIIDGITRTDEVSDSGEPDMGYHYPVGS